MYNNKKRLFDFLLIISVLVLIGVGFVFGAPFDTGEFPGNKTNLTLTGETGAGIVDVANKTWTYGGKTEIANISLNLSAPHALGILTTAINYSGRMKEINITIPSNYVLGGPIGRGLNDSGVLNASVGNGDHLLSLMGINCTNVSSNKIRCWNLTRGCMFSANASMYAILNIWFNVTAANDVESTTGEVWTITTTNATANAVANEDATFTTFIDGVSPRISEINISDSYGNVLKDSGTLTAGFNGTGALRNNTMLNLTFTVTDMNLNVSQVRIYYLVNGSKVMNFLQANVTNISKYVITPFNLSKPNSLGRTLFNVHIPIDQAEVAGASAGNRTDGGMLSFAIFVNDTYGHGRTGNTSNYTFFGSGVMSYNITLDGKVPSTPQITEPTYEPGQGMPIVTVSDSTGLTYSCVSTTDASARTYAWTMTKPSGVVVTKTGTSAKFSGTEISTGGTYSLTCKATDQVGYNSVSATKQFYARTASTTETPSTTGTPGTTPVDIDLSNTTVTEGQLPSLAVGDNKTIAISPTVTETLTVKEVTADSVTIKIASAPEVTIKIGETKEIDLNNDGTMDLSVKLNGITDGKADVTVNKLAGAAAVEPTTEEETTTTGEEETTTPKEEGSNVWLWIGIIVAVIIVAGGIWYFVSKKK